MIEVKKSQLEIRCDLLFKLYVQLINTTSRSLKEVLVDNFRKKYPKMEKDLDFCFEVLAGQHKLGYTYGSVGDYGLTDISYQFANYSIKKFVTMVLKNRGATEFEIGEAYVSTPKDCRQFIANLVNRNFKLGYSNKAAMITDISPMLAKKYPESHREQYYYIQEKLDGNRCIAKYNFEEQVWEYFARSGKPLKVSFNMSWADETLIYDGEVMTLGHAGIRDFNRTSGAINGIYTDKSQLHYYIYDIIADDLIYEERYKKLKALTESYEFGDYSQCWNVSENVSVLPVLDKVWVWPNPEYNPELDRWLDYIVGKGGEGIILRDPDACYQHKRTDALLKYKKVQTADLRIIGWNEGKGKYEGAIGSFICETDDHKIQVNVAGMTDDIRWSNPDEWIGKIIEVAYFDESKSKVKTSKSLRFPRMKKVRNDKNETSMF